jgi:rhodanese-related sulfurtransferase
MSAIAAYELVGLGYESVRNLDGGMNAWSAQGLPLLGPPAEIHRQNVIEAGAR